MTDTPHVRPFVEFLAEQAHGDTAEELSTGLRDLVARVKDTGKVGTLTYIVKVEPVKESDTVVVVTDEIRLKLPEHARSGSMYYTDREHNLLPNDPNQLAGFDIDERTGEVREPRTP
jgi:hypothetical protein